MARAKRAAEPVVVEGLSDEQLAGLGRKYRQARANEHQAKAAADELGAQLLAELQRRAVQTVELGEVVVTSKRKRKREWDVDALRRMLNRTQLRTVLIEQVSAPAVNALVKEGVLQKVTRVVDGVECEVIDEVEVVSWSAPYIDVTLRE